MARKRVLITGAAGYLSRQLLPVFRERYDLVLLDRRKPHGESVLMKALEALQGERYLDLAERRPANEAFLYGWLANRLG